MFGSRPSGLVELPLIKHYNVPGTGMDASHTINITFKFHSSPSKESLLASVNKGKSLKR